MERWRDIIGFEDVYQVSLDGNVRRKSNGYVLKQQIDRDGYLYLLLYKKKHIKRFIHRLVIESFNRVRNGDEVVCHNDGNPKNNHISNLRWDSVKNNKADEKKHGTALFGEKLSWTKLTKDKVLKIKGLFKCKGLSNKAISLIFNISPSTICDIKKRRKWRHI